MFIITEISSRPFQPSKEEKTDNQGIKALSNTITQLADSVKLEAWTSGHSSSRLRFLPQSSILAIVLLYLSVSPHGLTGKDTSGWIGTHSNPGQPHFNLINYIYKDSASKESHILRFWEEMNLGEPCPGSEKDEARK